MTTSEQSELVCAAYVAAVSEIEPAKKESRNSHLKTSYADLMAYLEAARGPLKTHKLAIGQEVIPWEHGIGVVTRITHVSGQWIEFGPTPIPVTKNDAQAFGSAITYGRRYAYAAALGMGADDDDGNSATQKETKAQPPPPAKPDGYAEWQLNMEAAADEGYETFAAAWKQSPQERRTFASTNDSSWVDGLKKRTLKVAAQ